MSTFYKHPVKTENAPAAIGPYSAGISTDAFVFTSGQLGLNPATNGFVEGGVEAQTSQALLNVKAILQAAGAELSDVVKTTVFLQDMADFAKMNAVYAEFFAENFPARSAVQVAALPKGGLVEIEAIAVVPQK